MLSTSFHICFNFSTFPEVLRRTQRGKGQTGQPLSCIAHTQRPHSSGGSFSFAPEIFRAAPAADSSASPCITVHRDDAEADALRRAAQTRDNVCAPLPAVHTDHITRKL